MTYCGFDFNSPADLDLYSRVIESSFEAETSPVHEGAYKAALNQYHASERARVEDALGGIEFR